jgi:23S rRNA pseudouridine1911/1915/1917 synthase
MLDEIRFGGGVNANPVHRIDMETSGLILSSCHKRSENYLKVAFEEKRVHKSYLAWVNGKVEGDFTVDKPLKVNNDYLRTKHKVEISDDGKISKTRFELLEYDEKLDISLLRCIPFTGRTHQIRVHLFDAGHPIIGDPLYGTSFEDAHDYLEEVMSVERRVSSSRASRLMLHAQTLSFEYKDKTFNLESQMDFMALKEWIV